MSGVGTPEENAIGKQERKRSIIPHHGETPLIVLRTYSIHLIERV